MGHAVIAMARTPTTFNVIPQTVMRRYTRLILSYMTIVNYKRNYSIGPSPDRNQCQLIATFGHFHNHQACHPANVDVCGVLIVARTVALCAALVSPLVLAVPVAQVRIVVVQHLR